MTERPRDQQKTASRKGGSAQEKKERDQKERNHEQEALDEGIEESFPASDPPSISRRGTTH